MNRIFNLIKDILNQPLSLLRISLPVLMGRMLIYDLNLIYSFPNNVHYALSKTWFNSLVPDFMLTFDVQNYELIKLLIIATVLCASFGILGRLSLIILSFLSFYVIGTMEGIGVFDHSSSLPAQIVLVLALVPGSMKLSVDYVLLKLFYKKKKDLRFFSENPKWSLNLILMLLAVTYLTAGISKLRYGNGINWLDGNTLSFYLKERTVKYNEADMQLIIGKKGMQNEEKWKDKFGFIGHAYGNYQTTKRYNVIADYVADNKLLVIGLSVGSVLFELLAFIMFINSKYRNIYLISAILFHTSIGLLMGLSFTQYRLICFCLIDWKPILSYSHEKLKNKLSLSFS